MLSRFQFTIGQLVQVIMLSGFVFWMIVERRYGGVVVFPWLDFVVRPGSHRR